MLRSRLQLREKLKEKLVEALQAVLPIVAIVLVLSFFIAPLSPSVLLCFLLGAVMIIFGMMFFTLGAEMSMTPMGERVGSAMTKSRSLPKMIVIGFILGFIITISEPDLQVLANQVPSVPNLVLILSVAAGVGAFLVIALLRMLFSMALPPLLVALDGVTDPRNLGAVVRSAAAFGAHGVIVPQRRSAGMTAVAWRTSAGTAAKLPVAQAVNLTRTLKDLKKQGLMVVGLDADSDVTSDELELATGPLVVVVGSEGRGLSRLVRDTCDQAVSIPMFGAVESLNASVASGVVLAEVARRRRVH